LIVMILKPDSLKRNPARSKCKHVYIPLGSFKNNRVCQYVNTTDLIVIEHYIAI
jgi:hypothetical protein